MKYIFTSLLFSLSLMLQAQAVTDFTLTDIDGTSHNLYTYLNQGKTVVLHFANTDCGDCWAFHQTQNMSIANDTYGPTGTDDMVFLLLETDSSTTISSLQGEGLYTKGDWITGTSHPIIDAAENVAADYNITELPAVIAICADTTSTDLYTAGYPTPSDMYITHEVCTPANAANDMTIIDVLNDDFCGALKPEILIMNTGTDTISTAQFLFSTGTLVDTIDWSGTLAPNEYNTLTFTTIIGEASTLTTSVVEVNGVADGSSFSKDIIKVEQQYAERITITIITDGYGCETQWTLKNSSGTQITERGNVDATAGERTVEYDPLTGACPSPGYDNNTTYVWSYPENDTVILASGCYEFNIIDDWGDGICCDYGDGSYSITDQDGNELAAGGDFGAEETIIFNFTNVPTVDIDNVIEHNSFNVFPNPAQDQVNLSFDMKASNDVNIHFYNALGQQVKHLPSSTYGIGNHTVQMETNDLPSGIYIVTLQTEEGTTSKKITITRP